MEEDVQAAPEPALDQEEVAALKSDASALETKEKSDETILSDSTNHEGKREEKHTVVVEPTQAQAQQDFIAFLNEKRDEHGLRKLNVEPLLLSVAQAHCERLQRQAWTGGVPAGKGPHRRYFEEGSTACVTECATVIELPPDAPVDAGNVRQALEQVLKDSLVEKSGSFFQVLDEGYSNIGAGIAMDKLHVYLVVAVSHQVATIESSSEISFRARQAFSGVLLEDDEELTSALVPEGVLISFFADEDESSIPPNYLVPRNIEEAPSEEEDQQDTGQFGEPKPEPGPRPADTENMSGCSKGTVLTRIYPWEMTFESTTRTFSFEVDWQTVLQQAGFYEIPRGVFHLRVYAGAGEFRSTKQQQYEFPCVGKQFCVSTASFSFPYPPGSSAAQAETDLAVARLRRLIEHPIQEVQLLQSGDLIPEGFEVYPSSAESEKLPRLCFKKETDKGDTEAGETSCVVELAVAFGVDDVPPGFDVVRSVRDNTAVSLRGFAPTNIDSDSGDEDDEKSGYDEEQVLLCVRLSDDPIEIETRGVGDIFFRLDDVEREQNHYSKLDIIPGSLHVMYRLAGQGRDEIVALEKEMAVNAVVQADLVEDEEPGQEANDTQGEDAEEDSDDDDDYDQDELAGEDNPDDGADEWGNLKGGLDKIKDDMLDESDMGECILPTAESKRAELEEAERVAQVSRIEGLIETAMIERERLLADNVALQKALVPFMAKKKQLQQTMENKTEEEEGAAGPDTEQLASNQDSSAVSEKERQYHNSLNACNDAQDTLRRTREAYDKVAMGLQTRLDDKEAKAGEIRQSFAHFKREIAKAAENSRTGKPIPMRIIKQFEDTELQKDTEVEKVRLKNINLRSQLRKLEGALHEKEKLAEGLHLIDFEQLKIENQTLNEKIEERNEELHKLRKKTTTTVQVLTHIKEKLQYVQAEAVQLKSELAVLDKEVTASRDQLTKSKHARDALRASNETRKRDQGFVSSSLLVQDFQKRKNEIKSLKRKIRDLQQKHANLSGALLEPPSLEPNKSRNE